MASTKLLMCLVFGLLSGNAYAQQQNKCKTPFAFDDVFPKKANEFIVAYNITSMKNVQSCVRIFENYQGTTKESFTITYTEAGVKYNRPGISSFTNNLGVYTYDVNPNEKFEYYIETQPNGISVNYICNGGNQLIWLFYENGRDLSKEADEMAKLLTANPTDYKISQDGC